MKRSIRSVISLIITVCMFPMAHGEEPEKHARFIDNVDGNIIVSYSDDTQEYLEGNAFDGSVMKSSDEGTNFIICVEAMENDAELIITGDASSTYVQDMEDFLTGSGAFVNAINGESATLTIEGNLETVDISPEWARDESLYIHSEGEGSSVYVTINGDISSSAYAGDGSAESTAVDISADDGGFVSLYVDGSVNSFGESSMEESNTWLTAIDVDADHLGSYVEVEIGEGANGRVDLEAHDDAEISFSIQDGGIIAEGETGLVVINGGATIDATINGDIDCDDSYNGVYIRNDLSWNETNLEMTDESIPEPPDYGYSERSVGLTEEGDYSYVSVDYTYGWKHGNYGEHYEFTMGYTAGSCDHNGY